MNDLNETLCGVVNLLESMQLKYAVMGGIAVRLYGIPRPTYDVDFTVSIARERLPQLFDQAIRAGYTVPDSYLKGWIDQVAGMPVVKLRLYLLQHGIDIDLFLAESDYQKSLLDRRRREEFEGTRIWFVSPEDLVLLKLIAGRPRDIGDIQDVLFTQGQLDNDYLTYWARELGVEKQLADLLLPP